jgi:alpha-galactosidase
MKKEKILLFVLGICISVVCSASKSFQPHDSSFINLLRVPDSVTVTTEHTTFVLTPSDNIFTGNNIEVRTISKGKELSIFVVAPNVAVKYINIHWNCKLPNDGWKYLGDAWERAYGDLEWKPLDSKRVMPWYFLVSNGKLTHGYGVMTGPSAACGWRTDINGVTLMLDVRNGGCGVQLGNRCLDACTIVERQGKTGESAFTAAQEFCRKMCHKPRMPKEPVYGFNDWYCDYGNNSSESIRYYADYIVRLSPKGGVRPFMVIDDGWQTGAKSDGGGGPWDCGNDKFPSMSGIAEDIRKAGAKPGIWIRLLTAQHQPASWRLSNNNSILDPSVPDVRNYVKERITRLRSWGFELIKHDFSTVDITGEWRSAVAKNDATWHFADSSRTTTEIIRDFYLDIREAAGDNILVMGCQTVSHLSAGIFDLMRIGDDTSGKDWNRTRKMGVNILAFRGSQHGTFYSADADCVGLTESETIPWAFNRQWLNLVAHSGTPLFISFKKGALAPEQEKEVAAALEVAAKPQSLGEPLDWQEKLCPVSWILNGKIHSFEWENIKSTPLHSDD